MGCKILSFSSHSQFLRKFPLNFESPNYIIIYAYSMFPLSLHPEYGLVLPAWIHCQRSLVAALTLKFPGKLTVVLRLPPLPLEQPTVIVRAAALKNIAVISRLVFTHKTDRKFATTPDCLRVGDKVPQPHLWHRYIAMMRGPVYP